MIFRAKAPLRLGLGGGGTDVSPFCELYGGYVLNATINKYAYCTIEATDDGRVSFYAADREEYLEFPAESVLPVTGKLDLHTGIYNRVVRQFQQGRPLSFRMTTYSDAPAGSGLGSSSTMVVAILQAYAEWLNLPLGEYDLAHLAYEIERIDIGLGGGRQDQYAATFGGFNFIEFYKDDRVIVNPLRVKQWIVNELESSIVLFYTGVSRESASIIKEQAENARSHNSQSIEAMQELKEDARSMKEVLLKGDLRTFSQYLGKSWEAKKRMAASITNSRLDHLYEYAIEAGAYSGKVSGAGGGGFMMFMVDPTRRIQLIKKLKSLDGEVMDFQFTSGGSEGWRI